MLIQRQSSWLFALSLFLSFLAVISGRILLQAFGVLLIATAGGFWIHTRLDRRGSLKEDEPSHMPPDILLGERLLPAIFTLATIIIIAVAIVGTWASFRAGP